MFGGQGLAKDRLFAPMIVCRGNRTQVKGALWTPLAPAALLMLRSVGETPAAAGTFAVISLHQRREGGGWRDSAKKSIAHPNGA